MDNIVFYFTGTGNSLKVAKAVSNALGDTEIISMGKLERGNLVKQYDTIGFVYPVYFWGMPNMVRNFVGNMNLINNKNSYYYGIATFGGLSGNGISQLKELLMDKHNIKLNYGKKIKMFANYIVGYSMSKKIEDITNKSDKDIITIINSITSKKSNVIKNSNKLFNMVYNKNINNFKTMDKDYIINNNCRGCGICKGVCPVKNIEIIDGKPNFKHNCEQCLACIQYCPQRAINYKNLTQDRGRYTNPDISYKELLERNA